MVSSGFDGFSKTEWKKPWRGLLVTYLLLSSILDLKTWWNEDLVLKCRNIHFSKRNIQNDSKLSSVISYVFRANTKIEEIICWRLNPMNYNMIIHVMSCHVMSCHACSFFSWKPFSTLFISVIFLTVLTTENIYLLKNE